MTRRLSERPEGSSGSLVARITLGGCHPKLQTPLAAADVRGRVATVAGGALAGDVVAAAGPRALAAV